MILWAGPKHSGKTTAATRLVEHLRSEDFTVAGLLAPSVYQNGALAGFDAQDLATGQRAPLLGRPDETRDAEVGPFAFCEGGVSLGQAALGGAAARRADLVVVDEFGPLELRGGGWRRAVDALAAGAAGTILLVVREGILEEVRQLYRELACTVVPASGSNAIQSVAAVLRGQL